MDNVGFQPTGDEIERALMDLGPLLGVSIKEEAPEELADAAVPADRPNDSSSAGPGAAGGEVAGDSLKEGEGADSLASPSSSLAATRCVICKVQLSQTEGAPKLMECLHSACEPCIKAKIEEKQSGSRDFLGAERITITCPACRLQCQPANMIDQRFVLEKLNMEQNGASSGVVGSRECSSCDEPEPASSYCVDCGEFICDSCVQAHRRLKITKDHTIKSKDSAVAELAAAAGAAYDMFCSEHPQERLSLFCETCDRLTCRDCQLSHHRDHKHQFSEEMAQHARSSIGSLLSEVSYKRVLLGSAMKVIKDRQALIADKKKALVREITQTVVKLTNAINTRGKQLVLRLNELCDGKQRTLAEKQAALEQLAAITDHCVDFVQRALQQGSDTAVLHSKRAVCAHLQRIKARRADIPNPEIPVRITLALDQLPALLHVLSTIGGIVVDGKMDGGSGSSGTAGAPAAAAGGAQGPYHPPQGPPAAPPAPTPPHSAVVALQQVAMQQNVPQSFVQARGGGGGVGAGAGGGGGGGGALAALQQQMRALRHPHVTSTTHPHHLQGMTELNLRGLLSPGGRGMVRAPPALQHAAHAAHAAPAQLAMHYQQMMGAYANANAFHQHQQHHQQGPSGRRSGGPRTPSPAPPAPHYSPAPAPAPNQHMQAAKWHIPQQFNSNGSFDMNSASVGAASSDFKITLSRPPGPAPRAPPSAPPAPPTAVTSTNPKTPSPSLNGGASELDAVCAESVQDLMATIAKLDSNGVQVLPERPPPSPAHHVSSTSTGKSPAAATSAVTSATAGAPAGVTGGAGDPNEDWCAVCMDGGELMCCDKCPKVFHQYCHIPTIDKLPDETETWQCLLCVNFAELPPEEPQPPGATGLSPRQQKIIERITLELYCQYEASLPFREPVPLHNTHYHSKVESPVCLDGIRARLQPAARGGGGGGGGGGGVLPYAAAAHYVADCRLLFQNAYSYNAPDSQIYKDAQRLEAFFESQLQKWLPEYASWGPDGGVGGLPGGPDGVPLHKRPRVD